MPRVVQLLPDRVDRESVDPSSPVPWEERFCLVGGAVRSIQPRSRRCFWSKASDTKARGSLPLEERVALAGGSGCALGRCRARTRRDAAMREEQHLLVRAMRWMPGVTRRCGTSFSAHAPLATLTDASLSLATTYARSDSSRTPSVPWRSSTARRHASVGERWLGVREARFVQVGDASNHLGILDDIARLRCGWVAAAAHARLGARSRCGKDAHVGLRHLHAVSPRFQSPPSSLPLSSPPRSSSRRSPARGARGRSRASLWPRPPPVPSALASASSRLHLRRPGCDELLVREFEVVGDLERFERRQFVQVGEGGQDSPVANSQGAPPSFANAASTAPSTRPRPLAASTTCRTDATTSVGFSI